MSAQPSSAGPSVSALAEIARSAALAGDLDRALDYGGVRIELARLGIVQADGSPYTERQVRRMADEHKLPFFKAPDRRRLIMRSTLQATVNGWQEAARRNAAAQRAEADRARRPGGRA